MSLHHTCDVLVIGSGAAGLTLALRLAGHARVAVLSKKNLQEGSTLWAQGGVAAVLEEDEAGIESHISDTLEAGAGLCHEDVVRHTVTHAKAAIEWLLEIGVPFTSDKESGNHAGLHLTREGGHSHRRIVHAADATGRAIETTLEQQARAHPNIRVYEHHMAIDLITSKKLGKPGKNRVLGAYVLDRKSGHSMVFHARSVALATGGASKVYLYTTNPDLSTGDGIAMGWRAGCRVANMEFNQFHPTCLYHHDERTFLLTEAIRGEGGRLLLPDGTRFMDKYDPRAELAPRDIVARAIDNEMKRLGIENIFLDISHKPESFIKSHFPNIYERTLALGYDMTQEPLPVVPAAHYTCGGIMTDMEGHTDVEGLYAIGEVSFTGLHGANRMASNSLLECLVFATSASDSILRQLAGWSLEETLPDWDESRVTNSDEEVVVVHNWEELRHFMWDYVGIVRTDKRLERAKRRVDLLIHEIQEYYSNFRISPDLLELRNLVCVADLIIRCAIQRKESRGLHYTLDYPEAASEPQDTVLSP
ncbi:MAG: L-aspartate oxidase [Gammaproteobacteria bacterium]|nr:L-aspartate oxidase [Gammaproteobacteria bacterium]